MLRPYFAVLGHPIAHSLSPQIHQAFAAQFQKTLCYEKKDVLPDKFSTVVNEFFQQGGQGLNITSPFKTQAYQLSDRATPRCQEAGAANTLWMKNHTLWADNTDGIGLVRDLSRFTAITGKKILILGAGGAVAGILGPLWLQQPAEITVSSRTLTTATLLQTRFPQTTLLLWEHLKGGFDLVIHATSAMQNQANLALPECLWHTKPKCFDLAYDIQNETAFVHQAKQHGCVARDGLGMLIEQAAEAFYLWWGEKPDTQSVFIQLGFDKNY